jgi:FKBP-type peptidyl-prolyl cis-trans isomerase
MSKSATIIILVVVLIIIGVAIYFLLQPMKNINPIQTQSSKTFDIQGMKVEILKDGTGEVAKVGDNIVVNYVGTLTDGTKFDSSLDRNQPFPYTLGQNRVIQGWELGILGMKVGEKRKLTIPSALAYGDSGRPPVIPEKATLIFEIDMLSINK